VRGRSAFDRGPALGGPCYARRLSDGAAPDGAPASPPETRGATPAADTRGLALLVAAGIAGALALFAWTDAPREAALHLAFGAFAGTYGALIGAGGGFLIVPFLLMVDALPPERAAGTSLAAVCVGAVAATLLAVRGRRIDVRGALAMGLATLPGAVVGASASAAIDPRLFGATFGAAMIALGLWLALRDPGPRAPAPPPLRPSRWVQSRVDVDGVRWRYDLRIGLAASAGIGVLSSLLGIGGGVLHVPLMIGALGFPSATAVATSQAILAASSAVGLARHATLDHVDLARAAPLAIGALLGATFARALAPHVRGPRLLRLLAAALGLVGVRLVARAALG
jgi:uncharacterized membrane protein YfcA